MVRPDLALLETQKLLTPQTGTIVCSIPNVRYFPVLFDLVVRRRWQYRDSGVLDFTHVRFFTFSSVVSLLTSAGYRIESLHGINGILDRRVPAAIRKLVESVRPIVPQMLFLQVGVRAGLGGRCEGKNWAPRPGAEISRPGVRDDG